MKKPGDLKFISSLMKYGLLIGALSYFIVFIIIALCRIRYPFELEWLEGGTLEQVRRILSGQKLYLSPSLKFVPFIYTPLYFYISAAVSKLTGIGFSSLRLVSLTASLGCFLIIFFIVKQETRDTFAAILASCLFVATFRICGAWFDIARVDSLFLALLLAALYELKFKDSSKSSIGAGIFISLSFLTKQIALFISLPIMIYCLLVRRRSSIYLLGTVGVIIGVSTFLLDYFHNGWYSYYIFYLPRQHGILKSAFFYFWSYDLRPISIAIAMSILYLFIQFWYKAKENYLFYFLSAAGMIGGAWLSRLHSGSYDNVLLPACAIISILFGLSVHSIFQLILAAPANSRSLIELYVYLVCIIQFACLIYNPFKQIPNQWDLEAGKKFITQITQIKGNVFIPYHPYLATLANKSSFAHAMAMSDIIRGDKGEVKEELVNQVREALRGKTFSAIFLDSKQNWFQEEIDRYYRPIRYPIFNTETAFRPVTGGNTRPEFVYVPR